MEAPVERHRIRRLADRRRPGAVRPLPRANLRLRAGDDRRGLRFTHAPGLGFNVIYLRASLPTFKPRDRAARTADGILIVQVVDDIDAEYERLTAAGIAMLTPIETEEWGERYFQVEDPNGVIVQLVQWVAAPPETVRI